MNISLIEFLVYGLVAYSGLLVLIFSVTREVPLKTKRMTLIKSMYMIPSVICCILLAGSGVDIELNTQMTNSTTSTIYETLNNQSDIVQLNSTITATEISTNKFILQNPIWILLHYLFALIMFAYLFSQILTMFTAKD